jgi:hypothetical protein
MAIIFLRSLLLLAGDFLFDKKLVRNYKNIEKKVLGTKLKIGGYKV